MNKNVSKEALVQQMLENAGISEKVATPVSRTETLISYKKAKDGNTYGIVQESSHFYIKKAASNSDNPTVNDFIFIDGERNKLRYSAKSISEAEKQLNMRLVNLNEYFSKIAVKTNDVKLVKEDAGAEQEKEQPEGEPQPEPQPEAEPQAEPSAEPKAEPQPEVEPAAEGEPDDQDNGEGEQINPEVLKKDIESMTGKLTQKMRSVEQTADLSKFVVNSILSAIDFKNLTDEDKKALIIRIKKNGKAVEEATESMFESFLKQESVNKKIAEDVANAMINWSTKYGMNENDGDFVNVSKNLSKEVYEALKEFGNEDFMTELSKHANFDELKPIGEVESDEDFDDEDDDLSDLDDASMDSTDGLDLDAPEVDTADASIPIDTAAAAAAVTDLPAASSGAKEKIVNVDLKGDTINFTIKESDSKFVEEYTKLRTRERLGVIKEFKYTSSPLTESIDSKIDSHLTELEKKYTTKQTVNEGNEKLQKYIKYRTENLLGLRENFKFTENKTTKLIDKHITEELKKRKLVK